MNVFLARILDANHFLSYFTKIDLWVFVSHLLKGVRTPRPRYALKYFHPVFLYHHNCFRFLRYATELPNSRYYAYDQKMPEIVNKSWKGSVGNQETKCKFPILIFQYKWFQSGEKLSGPSDVSADTQCRLEIGRFAGIWLDETRCLRSYRTQRSRFLTSWDLNTGMCVGNAFKPRRVTATSSLMNAITQWKAASESTNLADSKTGKSSHKNRPGFHSSTRSIDLGLQFAHKKRSSLIRLCFRPSNRLDVL